MTVEYNHNKSPQKNVADSAESNPQPTDHQNAHPTEPPKLDDMSLAWPAVVQLLVFIYSGIQ